MPYRKKRRIRYSQDLGLDFSAGLRYFINDKQEEKTVITFI